MKERLIYISVILALVISLGISLRGCYSKDHELQIANQNISALTDKTRETKNKLGKLQAERNIFMGDIETLKMLNADLMKEVEAQRGNIRVITGIATQFVIDTIRVPNQVEKINDSTYNIKFKYDKQYDSSNSITFRGNLPTYLKNDNGKISLESNNTTISDFNMRVKINTGIKEENGIYSVFAQTDFPGVKFDLQSAVIDPEKSFVQKRKGPFSLMVGGGVGYGLTQNGAAIVPSVGVFVGVNLLNF